MAIEGNLVLGLASGLAAELAPGLALGLAPELAILDNLSILLLKLV